MITRFTPYSKRSFVAACVVLLSLLLVACAPEPPAGPSIAAPELAARIAANDAPFILDVRTDGEFKDGHVPGAVHIPHTALEERIAELTVDKDEPIVVYCRTGGRAGMATEILTAQGFTGVIELEGHMQGWNKAGLPVE